MCVCNPGVFTVTCIRYADYLTWESSIENISEKIEILIILIVYLGMNKCWYRLDGIIFALICLGLEKWDVLKVSLKKCNITADSWKTLTVQSGMGAFNVTLKTGKSCIGTINGRNAPSHKENHLLILLGHSICGGVCR